MTFHFCCASDCTAPKRTHVARRCLWYSHTSVPSARLQPNTEIHSTSGEGNGLKFGLASMQGWRIDQEVRDRRTQLETRGGQHPCIPLLHRILPLSRPQDAHTSVVTIPGHGDCSWFAVFDGHGGSLVSNTRYVLLAVAGKLVVSRYCTPFCTIFPALKDCWN